MQAAPTIRIGTRGSPLALAQAHEVRDKLAAAHGLDATDITWVDRPASSILRAMTTTARALVRAAQRGECDIAGIHLLDPATDEYNRAFVTPDLELVPGYRRMQCVVFRPGDARFAGKAAEEAIRAAQGAWLDE